MKCPICGKEVELQNKQVGTDANGTPVFHEYAVCRDCKKQWDLDKQRAKKRAEKANASARKKTGTPEKPVAPAQKPISEKRSVQNAAPTEKPVGNPAERPVDPAHKKNAVSAPKKDSSHEKKTVPQNPSAKAVKPTSEKENVQVAKSTHTKKETAAKVTVKRDVTAKAATGKKESAAQKSAPHSRPSAPANSSTSNTTVNTETEQYYGNIPPEHVRAKRERAVRQSYEEMLATDPNYKPRKKKSDAEKLPQKKRTEDPESVSETSKKRPEPEKKRPVTKPEYEEEDDFEEDDDYIYYVPAKYRVVRVILGILSILGFGYFAYRGFLAGLDNIASGGQASSGTTYIVLAVCMLVSGLLLLILQNKRSVAAYIAPIIFYIAGAVFAFLKRDGDAILLYSAIVSAVLAVVLVILCATSRNQEDEDDYDEDEDDEFEDENFEDEDDYDEDDYDEFDDEDDYDEFDDED